MPKDEWAKARRKDIARKASRAKSLHGSGGKRKKKRPRKKYKRRVPVAAFIKSGEHFPAHEPGKEYVFPVSRWRGQHTPCCFDVSD